MIAADAHATGATSRPPLTDDAVLAEVWKALAGIPDPEIPVVSIVELGIVRAVERIDGRIVVRVTPTYSGCPATAVIARMIQDALAALGHAAAMETQLAPAWTTDWIAPEAKVRLRAYGIAPPGSARSGVTTIDIRGLSPLHRKPLAVPCPRCGSTTTRLVSQFGSTPCKSHYVCGECAEPFDYFKEH